MTHDREPEREVRSAAPTLGDHLLDRSAVSGRSVPSGPYRAVLGWQRSAGNRATVSVLRSAAVQRQPDQTSATQSTLPPPTYLPWTGDPVSMAAAMRDLLLRNDLARIADSLAMLWVRGMVDTLKVLRLDPGAYSTIVAFPRFRSDGRLRAAVDVVEGRDPTAGDVPLDQRAELQAMHDVRRWPDIIGPSAPPLVLAPTAGPEDPVRTSPHYLPALYDAIRRNRLLAGQRPLWSVAARPQDRVPGGYVFVGPSHRGERPAGVSGAADRRPTDGPGIGEPALSDKRKAVNEAIWHELGVGEGTQASINTWDSARFSFGPGFAAPGLLKAVMDNLAAAGADVLLPLRDAGVLYTGGTWWVVDPESRTVRSGAAALEVLARDVGLINTFLDTAGTAEQRQQWMDAEWKAMSSGSGAANIPDRVVENWPVPLIVFVAHCVHWGSTWRFWDREAPPDLFEVVRHQAARVPRQKDPRLLTLLSATTFRSFAGGLLVTKLRQLGDGQPTPLPDDWSTGHTGAVALPTGPANQLFQIIEPTDQAGP